MTLWYNLVALPPYAGLQAHRILAGGFSPQNLGELEPFAIIGPMPSSITRNRTH